MSRPARPIPLFRGFLGLLAVAGALGQTPSETGLSPEVLLLARIKVHMEKSLLRQPNYTCLERIERYQRRHPSKRTRLVDTLSLEVALVDGKEMYSWPGEDEFDTTDLRDIIPTGAVGTGTFASHARSVFLSISPTYEYRGQEELDGRLCERYDYDVPLNLSGYRLKLGEAEAIVAYYGSFWVDAQTLDLVRLDVFADEIPPHIRLLEATSSIEYERMAIGSSDFLLPSRAVTTLVHLDGDESRNEMTFTSCQQFAGESFLSFGDPPPAPSESAAESKAEPQTTLPAGLRLYLQLETEIESGKSTVGDEVRARLLRDVKRNKEVLVPEGATAFGRVVYLGRLSWGREYSAAAIQFDSLEFPGGAATFQAKLERLSGFVGVRVASDDAPTPGRGRRGYVSIPELEALPGVGVFYAKDGIRIPSGVRMFWRTVDGNSEEVQ